MARTAKNAFRHWRPVKNNPNTTAARVMAGGFFPVHHIPKFTISPRSKVFTMGSCFARNIESSLLKRGAAVLVEGFGVSLSFYNGIKDEAAKNVTHPGILNKFNPHSILTEIKRTVSDYPVENDGLIEIGNGCWFDPQATNIKPADRETVLNLRRQIQEVTSRITQADIVILTLGLTETWYDSKTGLSLNLAPSPIYLRAIDGRLYFKNSDFRDVVNCLREIFTLIRDCGQSGVKIAVTVSPVPLDVTFTGLDVVQANNYSKATLLSAAQSTATEFDFVDYYPSYEMVMYSPRTLAFEEDQAHVSPEMVDFVTQSFCDAYFTDSSGPTP